MNRKRPVSYVHKTSSQGAPGSSANVNRCDVILRHQKLNSRDARIMRSYSCYRGYYVRIQIHQDRKYEAPFLGIQFYGRAVQ